ncbi:MAG: peptidyl-prolyl cis-trans isomerase, partial [Lachnospiraceae bacterium]|nr:peptidyl-prolyl cis-trans isomerase [Lachnospiraceae bacterium]
QKIAEAAAKFVADNSEVALNNFTATEEIVKEYLELITLQVLVSNEIVKDVDTVVSDEEAAQRRIDYVYVNTYSYVNDKSESVEYTAEEKAERIELAKKILKEAKEVNDLDAAATAHGLTMATVTYGEVDTGLLEEVRTAVDALKEGEFADVIESEYGCYVAYVASDFDAAATEERKVEIIGERESALYEEVYKAWAEASEFVVNEDVWKQVTFAAPVTVITGDAVKDSDEVETYELNEDGEVVNSEDAE